MNSDHSQGNRPIEPDERFRLYIDESGDHVFKYLEEEGYRYLCLVGCWFRGRDYRTFHQELETFKQYHIPHNPDEPIILHREDIINRRRAFWRLRDPDKADAFDVNLLALIKQAEFRIVVGVIDKKELKAQYPIPAHPYHLELGFMLQRYCGFLNHTNRRGDVMAESRGGHEDHLLKDSYTWVHQRGLFGRTEATFFQQALMSKELKVKPKSANIAGLQLADLLANPLRKAVFLENRKVQDPLAPFAKRILEAVQDEFNRYLYIWTSERIWKGLVPQMKRPRAGPPHARPSRAIHLQLTGLSTLYRRPLQMSNKFVRRQAVWVPGFREVTLNVT